MLGGDRLQRPHKLLPYWIDAALPAMHCCVRGSDMLPCVPLALLADIAVVHVHAGVGRELMALGIGRVVFSFGRHWLPSRFSVHPAPPARGRGCDGLRGN